jgi:carotenoid cleavage dioxygenase-like enzyme
VKDKVEKKPTMIYAFSLISDDPETPPVASVAIDPPSSFFSFHSINAFFEANGTVAHLDLCVYNSMTNIAGEHVLGNLASMANITARNTIPEACDSIRRVVIDIFTSKLIKYEDFRIQDASLNSYRIELPSKNPSYTAKPYCYFYGVASHIAGSPKYEEMGIVKVDVCTAADINSNLLPQETPSVVSIFSRSGVYVGEPVFVPNPNAAADDEDDGVVLVIIKEGSSGRSALLILDGHDLTRVLAEIDAPFPLMFEFHGTFFAD